MASSSSTRKHSSSSRDGIKPPSRALITLPRSVYRLVWCLVLLLHVITGAFVLFAAFIHAILSLPVVHANTPALLVSITLKRISSLSYLGASLLHTYAILSMLRACCFDFKSTGNPTTASIGNLQPIEPSKRSVLTKIWRVICCPYRVFKRIFGPDGYFGIHGPRFDVIIIVRELVEITLQMYQLWTLRRSISRPAIIRFAVLSVVFNCLSVPIIRAVFHKREHVGRLAHVAIDTYLDFACAVVVPLSILMQYFLEIDLATGDFPLKLITDDVWYTNAVAEARQVIVTSFLDLFSSLLPQYSIYASLRLFLRMIEPTSTASKKQIHGVAVQEGKSKLRPVGIKMQTSHRRGLRIVSSLIGLWGCGVLALHIRASLHKSQGTYPGCLLHLRPWFPTNITCSVININCYRLNISGEAEDPYTLLDKLERSVLTRVIFSHCPRLIVPTIITQFSSLTGMYIHNSTLVDWSKAAAITEHSHPVFGGVVFISSVVSAIPQGLFHSQLPAAMATLLFYNCSLSSLPEDIGDVWSGSKITRIGFESTRLRSIPASLGRLPLTELRINNNQIEELPETLLQHLQLNTLCVSGNPLKKLPANCGDTSMLTELLVEHTNVSALPAWAIARLEARNDRRLITTASFYGSPVCAGLLDSPLCSQDWEATVGSVRTQLLTNRYPL